MRGSSRHHVAVAIAALLTGRQPQGIGPPPGHACELSSPRVQPSSSPGLHLPNRYPSPTVLPTRQTGGDAVDATAAATVRRQRAASRPASCRATCKRNHGSRVVFPRRCTCRRCPKTESGGRTGLLTSCDTKCCSRIRLLHLETVPSAPTPVRQRPEEPASRRQAGWRNEYLPSSFTL